MVTLVPRCLLFAIPEDSLGPVHTFVNCPFINRPQNNLMTPDGQSGPGQVIYLLELWFPHL